MLTSHDNASPYDPNRVKVDFRPYTIFQIIRKIRLEEIDLQPEFQRRVVWDESRQSRLIESILLNIPLPTFYLDAISPSRWQVVDGLQRLTTLTRFCLHGELRLHNLEFLHALEGLNFAELPREYQSQIEETYLNLYIIQPDVPEGVKFTIFYRINTGGVSLTPQEIRHCLFHGQATQLLKNLAQADILKTVTGGTLSPKRMDDREAILRFLAFYLTPYTAYQQTNWDDFLGQAMLRLNQMNEAELQQMRELFFETMRKAKLVFGAQAFRKVTNHKAKYPVNKALFEVWCVALATYSQAELVAHKEAIIAAFSQLLHDDAAFDKAISRSTTSVKGVQKRFGAIETLLKRVVRSEK